jgi:secretion/DNA translocation related TadE-like protein
MAGIIGVVVTLGVMAILVAGYVVGYHRARAAADLAALSGAAAFTSGGDACSEARRTARLNGARVTRCGQVGDNIDFVVTVRAVVDVRSLMPGLPKEVEAEAYAGRIS